MKKRTKSILLAAMLVSGLSMPAWAANVPVTLPNFPVTLNGTVIQNQFRQYPLLVYKDITYFPMTYYDCRFLGVETEWNQQTGLKIDKAKLTGAYHQQNNSLKNSNRATAQIATGKITVNGKSINNGNEPYPLLIYRDVTYFPLTWRFAVNDFGWKYNFTQQAGLTIDADNIKTSSVTLNDFRKPNYETDYSDFVTDAKYFYYQGEHGAVYRRPLSALEDEKQRKKLFEVPYEDLYYVGYPQVSFTEEDGHVYFRYHSGGATMGGDYLYRIEGDTVSKELIQRSYDSYVDFGEFRIKIDMGAIGGKPAIPMTYIGQDQKEKSLGAEGYCYSTQKDAYDKKRNVLYVSASQKDKNGQPGKSYLYAVSLQDGATKKISRNQTSNYQVTEDMIYYLSDMKPDGKTDANFSQQYLYALDLSTRQEQYIGYAGTSEITCNTLYAAAKNGVYYCDQSTNQLIFWNKTTGKTILINAGSKVNRLYNQNGYVLAHFEETAKNPYRFMVFAPSGQSMKQVYVSADCSDKAVINQNRLLVYRLEGTNQVVEVQL